MLSNSLIELDRAHLIHPVSSYRSHEASGVRVLKSAKGATLTDAHVCRICSCGVNGVACLCDGATPATYAACSTDADCQKFSAQGRCDTTSNTCQGRNHTTNPGCGACALPACNAAAP